MTRAMLARCSIGDFIKSLGFLDGLAFAGKLHHATLVAALEQPQLDRSP
jgi:hypothetical protein